MERLVVVGASLAGLRTVEALRRRGFRGDIVLVGDEPHAPYDRPPLSKQVLRGEWGPERLSLRKDGYDALGIELSLGTEARSLDLGHRVVRLADRALPFDGLVIATGARVRRLPNPAQLAGVEVLRTLDDALRVRDALAPGQRLVVVGAGFIGLEVAASARARGCEVTVVEALSVPLERQLGRRMGEVIAELHRRHGVTILTGVAVSAFAGSGRVARVLLSDGRVLPADLVVEGIGVQPNVEWLAGAGLQCDDGVLCDACCRVLDDHGEPLAHVVAVGDVSRCFNPLFGEPMRIEHWTHAVEQAEVAAQTLLGDPIPFSTAPMFWSDQYDVKIQFAGLARDSDLQHVCHGSIEEGRFVVLYGRDDRLVGVLAVRRPPQLVRYRRMIAAGASFREAIAQAA